MDAPTPHVIDRSIGAAIVHYGSWEPTSRAVASMVKYAPDTSVVVVDNGPGPAPADLGIPVIRSDRNVGYGAACNLAAAKSTAKYLLFSNNDVEVDAGTIDGLRRRLESDPGLAAAGPRFFDGSGKPRRSFKRAPTPWRVLCENLFLSRAFSAVPAFQGHHTVVVDESRARNAETLLGALFLVRREAFDSVGGFDERYSFYAEESDLFARLARSGWRFAFDPAAHAVHHGGLASASVSRETLDRWLHEGLQRYAGRFHGPSGRRATARALRAGARLRWFLSFLPGTPARLARRSRYADILRMHREGAFGEDAPSAR